MIKFSQEKVLLLHKLITEETGGDPNIRDLALLDSALESAFQTFDGQELYPTKEEKGARIGYALISNHAFVYCVFIVAYLSANYKQHAVAVWRFLFFIINLLLLG